MSIFHILFFIVMHFQSEDCYCLSIFLKFECNINFENNFFIGNRSGDYHEEWNNGQRQKETVQGICN